MPAIHSSSKVSATAGERRGSVAAVGWVSGALLGVGLVLGLALWSTWGFAIAFEAIRVYCF